MVAAKEDKQPPSEVDLARVEAASELSRLTAEMVGLQRQVDRIASDITHSEQRSKELTDAKFVTFRTLIDSQADKVALALEATEKAIGKAEIATGKAIDKQETANNDRFAAVNEFRAQLTDLISRFATLERVDLLYSQSRQRMDEVNNNLIDRIGAMGDRISELAIRLTKIEEYARGAQGNKASLYAFIGAGVGLITIVVIVLNVVTRNG